MNNKMKKYRNSLKAVKLVSLITILILPIILYGFIVKSAVAVPIVTLSMLCIYLISYEHYILSIIFAAIYYALAKLLAMVGVTGNDRKIMTILMAFMFVLTIARNAYEYKIKIKMLKEERKNAENIKTK